VREALTSRAQLPGVADAADLVDQLDLPAPAADLMASGAYDRNLRMLKRRYAARREHLVRALASHAPS